MPNIKKAKFAPLSASAKGVSINEFKKLTQIPIVLYYGDYIKLGSDNVGEDKWGSEMDTAMQFVNTINKHGGNATLVHLPTIGITGNSHFLMGEKNNQEIAELMAKWLEEKKLDK